MFHCEGGWNDVLDDMKTLFLLASFRVSGKNVMVPSFGNLAFDEVKSILGRGDPVVLWSTWTTLRVARFRWRLFSLPLRVTPHLFADVVDHRILGLQVGPEDVYSRLRSAIPVMP